MAASKRAALMEALRMLSLAAEELIEQGRLAGLLEGKQASLQEGKLEGKLEGEREGRRIGALDKSRADLARLPKRRFGHTAADVFRPTLDAASLEQLDLWFDRAIDAPSLDRVFHEGS